MTTELEDLWERIARPAPGHLNARRLPGSTLVWCAVDDEARRHLLVELDQNGEERLFSSRGLAVSIDTLEVAGEPPRTWVDLVCLDPALNTVFSAVAAELLARVEAAPDDRRAAVAATLTTWQWFWGNRRAPLTDEEMLGLFAELWFLDRWAPFPQTLSAWRGPSGGRHDFVTPLLSVEVKATRVRSDGPARHRVAHLDQLADPETGRLLLFSLRVTFDDLATNNLAGLVERLQGRVADDATSATRLQDQLRLAGWSPTAAHQYRQGLRVLGEELYSVEGDFPRLITASFTGGVPTGVVEVTYAVDLNACAHHRLATRPEQAIDVLGALAG